MTTLPQTTPQRLPRPNGQGGSNGSQGAMVQPMPLHAPAAPAGGLNMSVSDVWRVLRSNLWLILITLTVAIVAGYFVNRYLAANHSRYSARGFVQVIPPNTLDPLGLTKQTIQDNTTVSYEQRTQVALLQSDALFTRVLQNRNNDIWRNSEWIKEFWVPSGTGVTLDLGRAKKALAEGLGVTPLPETKLIAVTFSYRVPADCKTLIEELVNAHLRDQEQIARNRLEDRTKGLSAMRDNYETQLRSLRVRSAEKLRTLSLDGIDVRGRLGSKEIELAEMLEAQMKLQQNAETAQSQYEAALVAIQAGAEPPAVEEMVNMSQEIIGARQVVFGTEMALAASGHLGENNRYYKQKQAELEAARQVLEDRLVEVRARMRDQFMAQMSSTVGSIQKSLETSRAAIDALKMEMADLNAQMNEYLSEKAQEEALDELLQEVNRQIETTNASIKAETASVQWATRPEKPEMPSFPRLSMTMGMALFMGLALSLGIAFLRELLDNSVRSPRDIARIGQMSLLGIIPHEEDDPQVTGTPLATVIHAAPTSLISENYRQVRTRLQHAASMETLRSILVTSPSPEDGKTTVAANLAAGLALNGRRILLVDCNFRRPDLHRVFKQSNEVGLSTVLADPETFASAVRPTPVPNLDVLSSGPRPTNPTELLESRLLSDFTERALEEYDHVLFDSGPLLFASETVALAPRVDGVVTVVRARANSRGQLQRMRDTLRQLKVEHVGVVLNAVRAQAGGYYNRNIKTYYEYQNAGERA